MTKRPIVAFLYDFDKTLCTTDMEDYAFIPSLGYTPSEFWAKANGFGYENKMDGLLAYMYTMIRECAAQGIRLDRDYLVRSGEAIELFPGVREWFARITAYGAVVKPFGRGVAYTLEEHARAVMLKVAVEIGQ